MNPILDIQDLSITYHLPDQVLKAVRNASLALYPNTIHALVGESGSGKSTLGKTLLGLLPGYAEINFRTFRLFETSYTDFSRVPWESFRGKTITIVFQNPELSLNPVLKIQEHFVHLIDSLSNHKVHTLDDVCSLLQMLGFHNTERILHAYPSELSGGMQQRIALALALLPEPDILIADEPTTALDVTLQSQFLAYVRALQNEKKLTILWITHDLRVVAEIANHVHVMYRGWIIENAPVESFFDDPLHPYSRFLRSALYTHENGSSLIPEGDSSLSPSKNACPYISFCPYRKHDCSQPIPLFHLPDNRSVRCILYYDY